MHKATTLRNRPRDSDDPLTTGRGDWLRENPLSTLQATSQMTNAILQVADDPKER